MVDFFVRDRLFVLWIIFWKAFPLRDDTLGGFLHTVLVNYLKGFKSPWLLGRLRADVYARNKESSGCLLLKKRVKVKS